MNKSILEKAIEVADTLVVHTYDSWNDRHKEILLKGFFELLLDRKENLITIDIFKEVIKRTGEYKERMEKAETTVKCFQDDLDNMIRRNKNIFG